MFDPIWHAGSCSSMCAYRTDCYTLSLRLLYLLRVGLNFVFLFPEVAVMYFELRASCCDCLMNIGYVVLLD